MFFFFHLLSIEFVGCPLMENEEIVQQPVDLTTLAENSDNAAVNFINHASGDISCDIHVTYTVDKKMLIILSLHLPYCFSLHVYCFDLWCEYTVQFLFK